MPKYLTIIRHAKSSWENPTLDDIVRPLNERGKESIKIIGKYLKESKVHPDLIITSPAKRALKTAQGIGKLLDYKKEKLQIKQEIYFGNTTSILKLIKEIDDKYADVFLFGHEPILTDLIFKLTKNHLEKFPTCALYRIRFDINNWNSISSAKANCEFYVNPKLLIKK